MTRDKGKRNEEGMHAQHLHCHTPGDRNDDPVERKGEFAINCLVDYCFGFNLRMQRLSKKGLWAVEVQKDEGAVMPAIVKAKQLQRPLGIEHPW